MSGTSLDGIDIIYTQLNSEDWSFKILKATTLPYSKQWQKRLKEAVDFSKGELQLLDEEYTTLLGHEIKAFIDRNALHDIDAICSHGHTVLHQPENGITYQIGNQGLIASLIGCQVICDFRVQDVKFGGQGAPLVPIGDKLLFKGYDYCINLGGFANISYQDQHKRIAFDICPVNIVMNHYCRKIGLEYDNKGKLASEGNLNETLLADLNDLGFYELKPPKSLGLEWVKEYIFPLINAQKLPIQDVLRTFAEHVALQIFRSIENTGNVLITGGGAYNEFLISRIKKLSDNEVVIPSKEIIEYKEALIFALLGVLRLRGEVNCLSSVTGAKYNHSSGKIFIP